jgi:hypothetical protein
MQNGDVIIKRKNQIRSKCSGVEQRIKNDFFTRSVNQS